MSETERVKYGGALFDVTVLEGFSERGVLGPFCSDDLSDLLFTSDPERSNKLAWSCPCCRKVFRGLQGKAEDVLQKVTAVLNGYVRRGLVPSEQPDPVPEDRS